MAPKEKKTKEQIAAAAAAGSKKNKKVSIVHLLSYIRLTLNNDEGALFS